MGLVLVFSFFAYQCPSSFYGTRNLETIARQTTIVGTAALGMTLIIILGGIDLSVGSIIALSSVVIALMLQMGLSPLLAMVGGILAGAICGIINGVIITKLRVVPFIVTLGTLLLLRGAAMGLANEQKIDAPITWLNKLMATLPQGSWMLVPAGVWMMLALAVLIGLMLKHTKFGRYIFAIGGNEQAAYLCGVSVNRVKMTVYTLAAAFAGLAGVMQFSRLSVGDPTTAVGLELDVIASVVIGGGSLSGGEGSISGTLIGALIMTVISSGCSFMGLDNWVQKMVTGLIIVGAVALDRLRHQRTG
jgi:ribose/xylose/arabinose/galactoside ABC-type transport system permease subunit